MFAALDTLITLLIFGGIALVSHFIKRARGGDDFDEPTEPPSRGPDGTTPAPKRMTWEEELRKFLEQRPVPPPIVREAPRPAPMVFVPQPAPPPPLVEPSEPHIEVQLPVPQAHIEPRFQPLPQLSELTGYDRASHLQENVAKHFDELTHHRVASTTAHYREVSRETRDVLAMIRNPKSVRTAIVASLILGPPRALAD